MRAHAKINLMLHVTGKRADGFHLLQSLVVFAQIGDRLTYSEVSGDRCQVTDSFLTPDTCHLTPDFSLVITGPFATGLSGKNLVIRAAEMLGVPMRGTVTLEKNLPIGAGLGGGSADAATALRLLNQAWNAGKSEEELIQIAQELGSDVPACLATRPLWMEDTGHVMTPVEIAPVLHILLVNPRIPLATSAIYHSLTPPYDAPMILPAAFDSYEALLAFLNATHNILERPARAIMPELADILALVRAQNGCGLARMSGSGSTCFGLFSSEELCIKAADELNRAHPHWWVQPTTSHTHG